MISRILTGYTSTDTYAKSGLQVNPIGKEIADILLAVNRPYNKSDYIPCIAWGRNAKFSERLQIGDNLKVWGRIQSRQYQKKYENGKTVTKQRTKFPSQKWKSGMKTMQ